MTLFLWMGPPIKISRSRSSRLKQPEGDAFWSDPSHRFFVFAFFVSGVVNQPIRAAAELHIFRIAQSTLLPVAQFVVGEKNKASTVFSKLESRTLIGMGQRDGRDLHCL